MRNRLIVLSLLAVLIGAAQPSLAAVSPNKYSWPPIGVAPDLSKPLQGYHFGFGDDFTQGSGGEAVSFLSVAGPIQPRCTGFNDPACQKALNKTDHWWGNAILPPCKNANDNSYCVEGVQLIDDRGRRDLKLKRILQGEMWNADANHGSIPGSEPSLWSDPLDTDPTRGFKVTAGGNLSFKGPANMPTQTFFANFGANVTAYQEFPGGVNPDCIWAENNVCAARDDFGKSQRIKLTLHLPDDLSSWLIGRISDPLIQITDIVKNSSIKRVAIEASPVSIPLFVKDVPVAQANTAIKKLLDPSKMFCGQENPGCAHGYIGGNTGANQPYAFELYEAFKDFLDPKAQLMMPIWSVKSPIIVNTPKWLPCVRSGLMGVVTTNASIYEGEPPAWDGSSLSYKVAGVHLDPDGNVFQGSYDLILDPKFARCVYKFTSAPISATVSISDTDGSKAISTTVFKETKDWIQLSARGFTFSSPTVKVRLTQKGSKTTIVCIKGKTQKSVTAVSPKCPAGYKPKN